MQALSEPLAHRLANHAQSPEPDACRPALDLTVFPFLKSELQPTCGNRRAMADGRVSRQNIPRVGNSAHSTGACYEIAEVNSRYGLLQRHIREQACNLHPVGLCTVGPRIGNSRPQCPIISQNHQTGQARASSGPAAHTFGIGMKSASVRRPSTSVSWFNTPQGLLNNARRFKTNDRYRTRCRIASIPGTGRSPA